MSGREVDVLNLKVSYLPVKTSSVDHAKCLESKTVIEHSDG